MIDAINKAIYTRLNAVSGVTALLSSATAIYYHQAPVSAVYPYIVYIHAGGGDDSLTPTDSGDVTYYIKALAKTAATAGAIQKQIRAALHEQHASFTMDDGWTAYRVQAGAIIAMVENVDKDQIHHMGNSYRIRITQ